jgi:signal transduction histidine kinase
MFYIEAKIGDLYRYLDSTYKITIVGVVVGSSLISFFIVLKAVLLGFTYLTLCFLFKGKEATRAT